MFVVLQIRIHFSFNANVEALIYSAITVIVYKYNTYIKFRRTMSTKQKRKIRRRKSS